MLLCSCGSKSVDTVVEYSSSSSIVVVVVLVIKLYSSLPFNDSILLSFPPTPPQLKENPTLSNFFKGMSYPAFKKLADNYLEEETTPVQSQAPSLPRPVAAPELVKLAFTLDFTARLAGLSRQNVGYITGLGNRYLADRFEYTQVRLR